MADLGALDGVVDVERGWGLVVHDDAAESERGGGCGSADLGASGEEGGRCESGAENQSFHAGYPFV